MAERIVRKIDHAICTIDDAVVDEIKWMSEREKRRHHIFPNTNPMRYTLAEIRAEAYKWGKEEQAERTEDALRQIAFIAKAKSDDVFTGKMERLHFMKILALCRKAFPNMTPIINAEQEAEYGRFIAGESQEESNADNPWVYKENCKSDNGIDMDRFHRMGDRSEEELTWTDL